MKEKLNDAPICSGHNHTHLVQRGPISGNRSVASGKSLEALAEEFLNVPVNMWHILHDDVIFRIAESLEVSSNHFVGLTDDDELHESINGLH